MVDALGSITDDSGEEIGTVQPPEQGALSASSQIRPGASRAEKIIRGRRTSLLLSLVYWTLMTLASACFFMEVETGKKALHFGDALYMSIITATTIGFGDFSPHTRVGRASAIVWILVSTFVTANVLKNISAVFIESRALLLEEAMLKAKMSRRVCPPHLWLCCVFFHNHIPPITYSPRNSGSSMLSPSLETMVASNLDGERRT
jgi:hypothetical protein